MDEEKEDVEKEKDLETEKEEVPEVEKEEEVDPDIPEDPAEEIPLGVPPENVEEEIQAITIFETEKGPIHVVHEITFGDLIISTILMALLIFRVINQLVRRF